MYDDTDDADWARAKAREMDEELDQMTDIVVERVMNAIRGKRAA